MSNKVLHLRDPTMGELKYACWLRKSILSGRVVYYGFYSGCSVDDIPYVRVVFPMPHGNVTVMLKAVVQADCSLKLLSEHKKGDVDGYYRVRTYKEGSVKIKNVPFRESVHVYEDEEGTLRTDHQFSFWNVKFLHIHYKIIPIGK